MMHLPLYQMKSSQLGMANPEAYKEIMYYLVLEGAYTEEELAGAQVLTTLAGTNVGITTDENNILINNIPIEESVSGRQQYRIRDRAGNSTPTGVSDTATNYRFVWVSPFLPEIT